MVRWPSVETPIFHGRIRLSRLLVSDFTKRCDASNMILGCFKANEGVKSFGI